MSDLKSIKTSTLEAMLEMVELTIWRMKQEKTYQELEDKLRELSRVKQEMRDYLEPEITRMEGYVAELKRRKAL